MVHGSKGITPVISVILLLLITISIVGFAMIFMQRSAASTAEESEQQLAKQTSSLGENFEIININGNEVTVRNKGTAELKNLAFYVDENKVVATGSAIPKDGIGTFTLDSAQLAQYPGRKLKVSSSGLTKEENADFYAKNTVAYYTFDSTDGRAIKDESGNGNDGTFYGEAWNDGTISGAAQTDGKYGKALSFDGVDDYVNLGSSSTLLPVNTLTLEAWVKPGVLGATATVFSKGINSPWYGWTITKKSDNKWYGKITVGGVVYNAISDNTYTQNQWVHLAVTYDNAILKLYVDGVLQGTAASVTGDITYTGSKNPVIGTWSPADTTEIFNGAIDEVRIYNRALSAAEISEDMNSAYPVSRPVASWSFEKINGNSAPDTHNVVKGKYGAALSFDGVDDYVTVPDSASLDFGTGDFTAEYWMYYTGSTAASSVFWVVGKASSASNSNGFVSGITTHSGNGANFKLLSSVTNGAWGTGNLESGAMILPNTWHNAVLVRSATALKHYRSGAADGATTKSGIGADINNNIPLNIGRLNAAERKFKGILDEVRILDKAIG